jgi:hypothetical protein
MSNKRRLFLCDISPDSFAATPQLLCFALILRALPLMYVSGWYEAFVLFK